MVSDVLEQIVLGLTTSVISGTVVWVTSKALTAARRRSTRRFLGLRQSTQSRCDIVVGRMPQNRAGIHEHDVAAMMEVADLVRRAGGEPRIVDPAAMDLLDGGAVEFCLSGRDANARTGAHLDRWFSGLVVRPFEPGDDRSLAIEVDDQAFRRDPGRVEFAVLARICPPGRPHIFLISGQTGITNRAAAMFLVRQMPNLSGRFGASQSFCLVLRILEPKIYGYREVNEVADVTQKAITPTFDGRSFTGSG